MKPKLSVPERGIATWSEKRHEMLLPATALQVVYVKVKDVFC